MFVFSRDQIPRYCSESSPLHFGFQVSFKNPPPDRDANDVQSLARRPNSRNSNNTRQTWPSATLDPHKQRPLVNPRRRRRRSLDRSVIKTTKQNGIDRSANFQLFFVCPGNEPDNWHGPSASRYGKNGPVFIQIALERFSY